MRKAIVVLILAFIALPVLAAKPVTIEQLEQLLTSSRSKPDAELAQQLSYLQLSERASTTRLERLKMLLAGGRSREALTALADSSAFLAPPPSEIPGNPAPSVAEQRRIMGLVVQFVSRTVPQLPNFLATRVTTRFEDTPLLQRFDDRGFTPYAPIHYLGTSSVVVLYRDGRELVDDGKANGQKSRLVTEGLSTWGVFGPILGTVLVDVAQNKLAWARWELGPGGLQSIFTYSVSKEHSHYQVNYCCVAEEAAGPGANVHPFQKLVGYHGEITADPATGTILRLTVEADMKPTDPVVNAAIMVEYGAVEIGGRIYVCPVRSVSSTRAQTLQLDPVYKMPLARELQPLKTSLSDVRFEQYHVFRAESRVLTGNEASATESQRSHGAESPNATSDARNRPSSATPPVAGTTAQPAPAEPEISVAAASELPETPALSAASAADAGFTLQSTSRLVDLAVVASDKQGHPITNLRPGDFAIYDNGKAQKLRFFSQAGSDAKETLSGGDAAATSESLVFSNRPAAQDGDGSKVHDAVRETTILLIDSSNLAWGDLAYAREEMLRFLKTVPADERVGLYVLKSYGFQILMEPTVDHPSLAAMLSKWMPSALDVARAQDEEKRNRQQLEYVHSLADLAYVNGNTLTRDFDAYGSIDPQLRSLGSTPQRDALVMLPWIAQHLATIAGHKSLVWVSSDNVLADWSDKAPTVEKGSKYIEYFALRSQEALNEAHVSIFPLDASQLESGGISAGLPQANVQLNPTAAPEVQMGIVSRGSIAKADEFREMLEKSKHDIYPGRMTAQMQQDTHPIQGEFRELAEATGGRALRRAGDIAAELSAIVEDGRATYQLSFTPDTLADDNYHNITVAAAGRKDVTLRYRTGYLYSKGPATMKERFNRAIRQPRDANEIGVRVIPVAMQDGFSLKLNISAADLALKQEDGLRTDIVDIFLVARNDATAKTQMQGQRLGLRLRPVTWQAVLRDGIPFDLPVRVKPEDGSLRIVAVDENSGRIGSVTLPVAALGR